MLASGLKMIICDLQAPGQWRQMQTHTSQRLFKQKQASSEFTRKLLSVAKECWPLKAVLVMPNGQQCWSLFFFCLLEDQQEVIPSCYGTLDPGCNQPAVLPMVGLAPTDRAGRGWSGTAAATASTSHSPVTADFPRASRSSCAPPPPPPSPWGRREMPAPCRGWAASFPRRPATGRRAAEDRGRSRAPLCRSRRACVNRPSRSPGRSLAWSKRLSTPSYLRRSKSNWRRS